jgi:hypothetical protein
MSLGLSELLPDRARHRLPYTVSITVPSSDVHGLALGQKPGQARPKRPGPSQAKQVGLGLALAWPGLHESQKPWPGPWLLTELFETISGHHCHSIGDTASLRIKLIYLLLYHFDQFDTPL